MRVDIAEARPTYPFDTSFQDDADPYVNQPDVRLLRRLIGDDQVTGSAYAWGKTARIVCQPFYQQAVENTQGPVVTLDLCSSYPIWPQILREEHRMNCFDNAGVFVGLAVRAIQDKHAELLGVPIPSLLKLEDNAKRRLRDKVSPRKSTPRLLMQAALGDLLSSPPITTDRSEAIEIGTRRLMSKFASSVVIWNRVFELEELVGRGRWEILIERSGIKTFNQEIENLVGDARQASRISADIAAFLSTMSAFMFRQHQVFSVDFADPDTLRANAAESFPGYIKKTEFFQKAGRLKDHVTADIFHAPFNPESATFLSCVEGYPFYFKDLSPEGHAYIADTAAELLKPGGKAVFFPWHIYGFRNGGRRVLNNIEGHWRNAGLRVRKKSYYKGDLEAQMGDRETMLTMRSPVFADSTRSNLTALILEKPK